MSNAGTRHSAKRPREPWAKNYTEQGQGHTVYKIPELGKFGAKQFDSIKTRLHKVAHKYLLPAGYEFQQIAYDFNRLVKGKEIFDGDALEAIVQAPDNNARAEALETFAESVLSFYDDLQMSRYTRSSARRQFSEVAKVFGE